MSTSIERQREMIMQWADVNGHTVAGFAVDVDVSGSVDPFDTPRRPVPERCRVSNADTIQLAEKLTTWDIKCLPVDVHLDDNGEKQPKFRGSWSQQGACPSVPGDVAGLWGNATGIAINTGLSGLVVIDIDRSRFWPRPSVMRSLPQPVV
jgi:hypothetical protein